MALESSKNFVYARRFSSGRSITDVNNIQDDNRPVSGVSIFSQNSVCNNSITCEDLVFV